MEDNMFNNELDAIIKYACDSFNSSCDYAKELAEENEQLRNDLAKAATAAAELQKITLEKVASTGPAFSKEAINNFLNTCVSCNIIADHNLEKFASECMTNPESVLILASQAIVKSEPPVSQGRSIKTASAEDDADMRAYKNAVSKIGPYAD